MDLFLIKCANVPSSLVFELQLPLLVPGVQQNGMVVEFVYS